MLHQAKNCEIEMSYLSTREQKLPGVLVTGAQGYIGTTLLNRVTNVQGTIVSLDKLEGLVRPGQDHFIGDFGDEKILTSILQKYDIHTVIHLAALKSVSESMVNPIEYLDVNYFKTSTMYRLLTESGLERFIFASSAAIYAEKDVGEGALISEEDKVLPGSPYGVSKIAAEYFLESACGAFQSVDALRIFNVAGIYAGKTWSSGAVNMLCDIAANGGTFFVKRNSKGESTLDSVRDYISVNDVTSAIWLHWIRRQSPVLGR